MAELPRLLARRFAKRRIAAEPRPGETSEPVADPDEYRLPDRMPTREELLPDGPMVVVSRVCTYEDPRGVKTWGWTWRCHCHPGAECATPWPEELSQETAAAEHDLMVGVRTVSAGGRWLR